MFRRILKRGVNRPIHSYGNDRVVPVSSIDSNPDDPEPCARSAARLPRTISSVRR